MSLGIDKVVELKKEIVEFAKDVALVMEDKKISFGDAVPLVAAAKDAWDISTLAPEAYAQLKDLDSSELAEVGKVSIELFKELSELFGLAL